MQRSYPVFGFSPALLADYRRLARLIAPLQQSKGPASVAIKEPEGKKKSWVVFAGSFNPPTHAHLAMIKQVRQAFTGSTSPQICLSLSQQSVDKESVERPTLLDRLHLLEAILEKREPHAALLVTNQGLYVEQAELLRQSYTQIHELFFLIGYDKIVQILDPRYYEDREQALARLFRQAKLLVAPRGEEGQSALEALLARPENCRYQPFIRYLPFHTGYRDISSSQVRQSPTEAWFSIPEEVRRFFWRTRAYASPLSTFTPPFDYYHAYVQQRNALLRRDE